MIINAKSQIDKIFIAFQNTSHNFVFIRHSITAQTKIMQETTGTSTILEDFVRFARAAAAAERNRNISLRPRKRYEAIARIVIKEKRPTMLSWFSIRD